jgi:hypothetical protein
MARAGDRRRQMSARPGHEPRRRLSPAGTGDLLG